VLSQYKKVPLNILEKLNSESNKIYLSLTDMLTTAKKLFVSLHSSKKKVGIYQEFRKTVIIGEGTCVYHQTPVTKHQVTKINADQCYANLGSVRPVI
jgi:hypothetical protein